METQERKPREQRTLSRNPAPGQSPLKLPRSYSKPGTPDRCANKAPPPPCIHPQSIHTLSLGKIEWKMPIWGFDCPGSVGEENLQPRTCQTRHEHTEYSRVFMSLGKERWKILPFAYSHHVLRRNEFGFSRKRLQINNHRRASGYSSSLGTGWLNSPFPAAGTPSGGAQPCHASGRLWWQFPAVPVLGCPSATSTLACIPPHPAELAPACKAPLGSLEG